MTLRELHLFAGSGGGLLASVMLGHRPVCAVEIDPYCRAVLQARRDEGWLPAEMEIYDDITTFDGRPWRGRIDLVAGGFPCQDLSVAGKGAGLDGARSGLFYELMRIVREVRPRWLFLENVPAITSRGLDRVLGSLAELGFDAEWCVLSASDVGAPHLRKRWWCLARHANGTGWSPSAQPSVCEGSPADAFRDGGADVPDAARGRTGEDNYGLQPRTTGTNRGLRTTAAEADSAECAQHAAAVAGRADVPDADCELHDGRGDIGPQGWHEHSDGSVSGADDSDAAGRGFGELRSAPRQAGHADGVDAHSDADSQRRSEQRQPQHRGEQGAFGHEPHRLCSRGRRRGEVADAVPTERRLGGTADGMAEWLDATARGYWTGEWETQPRLAQGQAHRAARLRALGNGQVPQTAAMAFRILMQRYESNR